MKISNEKIERGKQQLEALPVMLKHFDPTDEIDNEFINLYFEKIADGVANKYMRK